MFLKKKWFEGSLKLFQRHMRHPDVAFAIAKNKYGVRYVFLRDPETGTSIHGDIIGIVPDVPKTRGVLVFNTNRDIDEHKIVYYTRNAYQVVPGLLYAPNMQGVLANTNLYGVMLDDHKDVKIHLHTDTMGDEWYVNRSSFRSRCIMLHYQPKSDDSKFATNRSPITRWVYGDVVDQYAGEWFFGNLTKENITQHVATKAHNVVEPVEPKVLTFAERCEATKLSKDGNLIVDREVGGGIWEREHFDIRINLEDMIENNQVLNLRPMFVEWIEQFKTKQGGYRIMLDIDRCGFYYDRMVVAGHNLSKLAGPKFYLSDVNTPLSKLHLLESRKFPRGPW